MTELDSINELVEAFGRLNDELTRAIELFKEFSDMFVDHSEETYAVKIPEFLRGDWKAMNWKGESVGVTDFDFLVNRANAESCLEIDKDFQIYSLTRDEPNFFQTPLNNFCMEQDCTHDKEYRYESD